MTKVRVGKVFYQSVSEAHLVANNAVSTEVGGLRSGCFQCQTGDQVVALRGECEALVRKERETLVVLWRVKCRFVSQLIIRSRKRPYKVPFRMEVDV